MSHATDFEFLLEQNIFKALCQTKAGLVISVVIISTDGGPYENPRYKKVIVFAIDHFRKYDLDALFLVTNAPVWSAYNPVERRLASLGRTTSGVILDHDHYGSHLSDQGKTIDLWLEKKFQICWGDSGRNLE